MSQIVLVGGINTRAFEAHLEEWGATICACIPYLPLKVPRQATALIVLKTNCSHNLSGAATTAAQKVGIPLVIVSQNWAKALPRLQQAGVLPTVSRGVAGGEAVEAEIAGAGLVFKLQSKMVRLEVQLGEAEDLLLERDDLVMRMDKRLNAMSAVLEGIKDKMKAPLAPSFTTKTQRAALALDLLEDERTLACLRQGKRGQGGGQALDKAGQLFGVSRDSVWKAENIAKAAPEVLQAMKDGLFRSIPQAQAVAAMEPEARANILQDLRG